MKHRFVLTQTGVAVALLALCLIAAPSTARAQALEIEPNNSCASPQNLGNPILPFVLNGGLTSTQGNPDVDFFRFTGTPNTAVVVDLEGSYTGGGTLTDPYLGWFNSACALQEVNDDGYGLNARLTFTIPADGVFILGVSQCCDYNFVGGGVGTYRLTVRRFQSVHSIGGAVVDSLSGVGLPGNTFPFARVELRRCTNGQCYEYVASQSTDATGHYRFDHDTYGRPLPIGTYQLFFSANLYVPGQTQPFAVIENEDHDLGAFLLTPLPRADSISGRLVDANTRVPLSGMAPTYAYVYLYRCDQYGCYSWVSSVSADSVGRFRFDRDYSGNPLLAGSYHVVAYAQFYQTGQSDTFPVAEHESKYIGDVLVPPIPVRFTDVRPCANIPAAGGTCVFSLRITNGLPTTLNARTWGLVDGYGIGSFLNSTLFQIPDPPIVSIPTAGSQVVQLRFEVPGTVRSGATLCPRVYVGQALSTNPAGDKNASFFNSLGQITPFCIYKQYTGFNVMTEQETRTFLRQQAQQPLVVDPGKH